MNVRKMGNMVERAPRALFILPVPAKIAGSCTVCGTYAGAGEGTQQFTFGKTWQVRHVSCVKEREEDRAIRAKVRAQDRFAQKVRQEREDKMRENREKVRQEILAILAAHEERE